MEKLKTYITFHHNHDRYRHLKTVLHGLAAVEVGKISVDIFTNEHSSELLAFLGGFNNFGMNVSVYQVESLAHPYELTWAHKPFLQRNASQYDYHLYLEDDIAFTNDNFQYFKEHLAILRASEHKTLIPGFARYEVKDGKRFSVDCICAVKQWRNTKISGNSYVSMWNPYQGMFIMDGLLLAEYINSGFFDFEKSKSLCVCETRERSAIGLTFDKKPNGFNSRIVVALDDDRCMVQHVANNYVGMKDSNFGKVGMEELRKVALG